jgi:hypothetical protein
MIFSISNKLDNKWVFLYFYFLRGQKYSSNELDNKWVFLSFHFLNGQKYSSIISNLILSNLFEMKKIHIHFSHVQK